MTTTDAGPSLRAGTLWAGCVAVGVAQVGIVLPAVVNGPIQATLHTSGAELSWIGDAYLLPIALLGLTFGVLGDLHGRKKILVGGALAAAVGFVLASQAATAPLLVVGQAVSGIGAAALFQSSLAVIAAATPDPRRRARGLAAWAVGISASALLTPLLAGVITELLSYHWVFAACAVIAVVSAALSAVLVTDSSAPAGRAPDWPGQATLALAVLAFFYGVIEGPANVRAAVAFVVAVIAAIAFVRIEIRAESPLLRLDLFRVPAFATAAIVAVLGMFAFIGGGYVLSIRLGVIQHETPMGIAWPFVVLQIVPLLLGPALARLLRGIGPRLLLVAGLLALAAGHLWLSAVPVSATGVLPILGVLVLNGIGFVLLLSGLTAAMVNAVPVELAGMASGTASVVRDLGQTLGPAVIGTVALGQAAPVLAHGIAGQPAAQAVFAAGGPIAVAGARLGPEVDEIATRALAQGYSAGLVVTAGTAVVAALVAALFLRESK
ncbi:MFS transporter [Kutzneria sp. NPDC052558]|uniref:MFS transporter n=1 Tax=Kutzneria sp. NPDC052558 TaxID=3364121 RepID=UPI0037C60B76